MATRKSMDFTRFPKSASIARARLAEVAVTRNPDAREQVVVVVWTRRRTEGERPVRRHSTHRKQVNEQVSGTHALVLCACTPLQTCLSRLISRRLLFHTLQFSCHSTG